QPQASGFIPNSDVDGLVTIPLSTFSLHYHPGDQFTFAIEGSGEGNYLWYSYQGFDAKLHREFRLFGSNWTLDDPPLNPPPSYAPAYSTYLAVPEPTTTTLLLLGMLAFVPRRR
ncbi:MAG: PEP-CTERM sorting domain-containing protein, partial [Patescibacteria group bacterium]|nr:PEP-CTERM sorting domain-containing protein [Patescibacteria group bacterium]